MIFRWCQLLLCALTLAACAGTVPLPVTTLTPQGSFEWDRGRAVLRQTSEHGVSFQAAFERDRGEYLEWWIRIENHSERTLQVSTDYFFYRVAETEQGGLSVRAVDPTRLIAELDTVQARADVDEAKAAKGDGDLNFFDRLLHRMWGVEDQSPSERRQARRQRRATYLAEREAQERWRELLANHSVRRTTLRPGQSVQGMLLFPRVMHRGRTELVLIVKPAVARFAYDSRH